MSFTKPSGTPGGSGFNSLTPLPSMWLNYVSNNFPSIVDGVGGGKYELTGADLRFVTNSRRVKFNMADPSFPVELRGYVTIGATDESGYATGVGSLTVSVPATFSAGITYSGAIVYSSTVAFNGTTSLGSSGTFAFQSGSSVTSSATFSFSGGAVSFADNLLVSCGADITFTAAGSITMPVGSTFTSGGSTTRTGPLTLSGSSATTAERNSQLNAVSAAATISTSADWWYVEGPTNATTVYTVQSSGPTPPEGAVLQISGYNVGIGNVIEIRREDASLAMTIDTGNGSGVLRFAGGRWRVASYSGNVTPSSVF